MAAKDKAVETTEFASGDLAISPAVQAMMIDLREKAGTQTEGNAAQISLDILDRILNADSLEDGAGGTTDLLELYGVPLTVLSVKWQPSKMGQLGVFGVIDVKTDDGVSHTVTCGGLNVVAILYRAEKDGRFPMRAKFRDVPTNGGFTALWLDVLPA